MRKIAQVSAAVALTAAVMTPTVAQAASFEWSWRKSGNTVTYTTLTSRGGATNVERVTTWCTWGESDPHGPFSVDGTLVVRGECSFGVNSVTVTLQ